MWLWRRILILKNTFERIRFWSSGKIYAFNLKTVPKVFSRFLSSFHDRKIDTQLSWNGYSLLDKHFRPLDTQSPFVHSQLQSSSTVYSVDVTHVDEEAAAEPCQFHDLNNAMLLHLKRDLRSQCVVEGGVSIFQMTLKFSKCEVYTKWVRNPLIQTDEINYASCLVLGGENVFKINMHRSHFRNHSFPLAAL